MHTEHVKYALMDFISGHVDEREHTRIDEHITQCQECQEDYKTFLMTTDLMKHNPMKPMDTMYYSTILPRVRERLLQPRGFVWVKSMATARIALPFAVLALCLALLIKYPFSINDSEISHAETFHAIVNELSMDEIVQAAAHEYGYLDGIQEKEFSVFSFSEQLQEDYFIQDALVKQMENEDISDITIDGMLSALDQEQVDRLLLGLTERKML